MSAQLKDILWYRETYLRSPHWRWLRQKRLELAGFRCECCGRRGRLDVHHLRYRALCDVTLDDLRALCRECHDHTHAFLEWRALFRSVQLRREKTQDSRRSSLRSERKRRPRTTGY